MTQRSPASLLADDGGDGQIRVIPFQGCQNFRDLGGYRAADGRRTRWRMIFRSAAMHGFTAEDGEMLRSLGVKAIVDLRSTNEQERDPLAAVEGFIPTIFSEPYVFSTSPIGSALPSAGMASDEARKAFQRAYGIIPYQFARQYSAMFAQLLAGNAPIIVNCSGGKDRTGVASALLLSAFGVPRDTMVEDYLLSRIHFQPRRSIEDSGEGHARWQGMAPELMDILRGVDESYLSAAFAAIDEKSGGLEGYLQNELGLSHGDVERLRDLCLE